MTNAIVFASWTDLGDSAGTFRTCCLTTPRNSQYRHHVARLELCDGGTYRDNLSAAFMALIMNSQTSVFLPRGNVSGLEDLGEGLPRYTCPGSMVACSPSSTN